jgi:hypothetical protein
MDSAGLPESLSMAHDWSRRLRNPHTMGGVGALDMTERAHLAAMVVALALLVPAFVPGASAASDPQGDATNNQPDHDILEVAFAETMDELRFTVKVAGTIRAPLAGVDEVSIAFRVVKGELYTPNVSPQAAGLRHRAGATGEDTYGVFRTGGFGYVLPTQPLSGQASATWAVPKAYLDATAAHRPRVGDWISDIRVTTEEMGMVVDEATHPDVKLAVDSDAGRAFFLGRDGGDPNTGPLRKDAPTSNTPETATLFHQGTLRGEWISAAITGGPLKLRDLGAVLWLSTTTSTPALSDSVFLVDLYSQSPDGARTLVARRAEAVSPVPGATTNLFLTPGAPQRMPFQLQAVEGQDRIPSNHKAVLVLTVDGLFSGESGPIVVYHDGVDHDSFLLVGAKPVPRPDHARCPAPNQVHHLPKAAC